MWLMSTFENENLKIIFFVSTFLDWYNIYLTALTVICFYASFLHKVV